MKLIGSDYDGTLNWGGFDDEKRQALIRWGDSGNAFAVVSGRPLDSLLAMRRENRLAYDYLVADNGAVIAHVDGTVIEETRTAGALAYPLMARMFANGCPWCEVHADRKLWVYATSFDGMADDEYTLETVPNVSYFTQISTMLPDFERSATVTAVLKEAFGEHLNPLQNGICIDVVGRDVNKAAGLRTLARHLGVAECDIIAVGDNVNDTDMIAAFFSYAMENGVDSIKKLANRTTPSVTALIHSELQNMR